jgi:hypothetical protein
VDEQLVATKTRLKGVEHTVIEHGNELSAVNGRVDALEELVGHAEKKKKKEKKKRAVAEEESARTME